MDNKNNKKNKKTATNNQWSSCSASVSSEYEKNCNRK